MAAFGSLAMQFFQQRRGGAEQDGVARQHRLIADVLGDHCLAQPVGTHQDQVAGLGEEVQRQRAFNDIAFDLGGPGPIEIGHGLKLLDLRKAQPPFQTAVGAIGNLGLRQMIRHARPAPTLAVLLLPVPVVEPTFQTLLIAAVGSPVLPAPGFGAARRAAIALSAIAMCTNPEHRLASLAAANALPENHLSMNRHPPTQADFDNGNGSCQGRTGFDVAFS
jgi:hypothetical protein